MCLPLLFFDLLHPLLIHFINAFLLVSIGDLEIIQLDLSSHLKIITLRYKFWYKVYKIILIISYLYLFIYQRA